MQPADEPGEIRFVGPGEGHDFWQPVPANGFVSVHVSPALVRMDNPLAVGTQTVPPGCYIREHVHDRNEEVIHVVAGAGKVRLDGAVHELRAGTTIFIGKGRPHMFINDGGADLTLLWIMTPNGLETFFERIGRPKQPGEPAPAPFPRPADVLAIEQATVFGEPIPDPNAT